jgi:hypothetical protein
LASWPRGWQGVQHSRRDGTFTGGAGRLRRYAGRHRRARRLRCPHAGGDRAGRSRGRRLPLLPGHTGSACKAGLTLEQTIAIREDQAEFDPKLAALLAVAREITGNVGEVEDTTWKGALEAGWTDTELTELLAHVAVNLYTNYVNHYASTELDIPAAPELS